jgi:hypothetical protein
MEPARESTKKKGGNEHVGTEKHCAPRTANRIRATERAVGCYPLKIGNPRLKGQRYVRTADPTAVPDIVRLRAYAGPTAQDRSSRHVLRCNNDASDGG